MPRNRNRFYEDWRRHSSVQPLDIVRNEGDVMRPLYSLRRPLTIPQRIGAVLIGICLLVPFGASLLIFKKPSELVGSGIGGFMAILIAMAFAGVGYIGARLIWNGINWRAKSGR